MNCGFEDVRVLSSILDHYAASPSPLPPSPLPYSPSPSPLAVLPPPSSLSPLPLPSALARSLATYSSVRAPSLRAIQSLAASNYAEMASSVLSPLYVLRLSLDRVLSRFFTAFGSKDPARGGTWESLYRMVTFRHGLAYEEALRRRQWQTRVLETVATVSLAAVVGATVFAARALTGSNRLRRD